MNSSSNFSSNSSTEPEDEGLAAGGIVASVILSISFLVGTPGNLLVLWIIVRHIKRRSHTLMLILNLAVADLLVVITLPLWIYSLVCSWGFSVGVCKAMVYVIYSCMYVSVFLITIMSVERFLAIRYPFKMLDWKNSQAIKLILGGVWLLGMLLGITVFFTRAVENTEDDLPDCFSLEYDSLSLEVFCTCLETLVGFVVPFLTLIICYCQVASQLRQMHRTNQRASFLIIGVVVAFALCWLPHHILNSIKIIQLLVTQSDTMPVLPEAAVLISGALAIISSSVNPILYAFAARNFQGDLRKSRLVRFFQEVTSNSTQTKGTVAQSSNCTEQDTV